jgi:flagellar hook-associated protein 2
MGSIRSGIGLISGIDTNTLVQQLISLQRAPVIRLQQRASGLNAVNTALKALEANLLTLSTSVQELGNAATFSKFTVTNSDESQLTATATDAALPGTYHFQTIRRASTFQALSKGFANADQQAIGAGTLVIQNGGQLLKPTRMDALNAGDGVQRGVIRITDRAGNVADVDLRNAFSVDDVLAAINDHPAISVTASTLNGHLILTDASGTAAGPLSVADLGGTTTAADLGIAKSVAGNSLTGDDVFVLDGAFTLDQINDGNGIRRLNGAPDVRITAGDGTQIDVNLDSAFNLNDVIAAINDHESNAGKVTAALVDGRLTLTDNTGGTAVAFQAEDINGTSVVRALGIDLAASGGTITGRRLLAGIDSVLLHNLRGGQGIDVIGQLSLTDRAGNSATVDLSGTESLDEVLLAINAAETTGGTKLTLIARINSVGTGIEIVDTSGATASNLVVADVGGSTLAAQLGIAVDAAQDSVNSGSLDLRRLNGASSLEKYAPGGNGVSVGKIRITDSAGNSDLIDITSAVKNIGDVLQRINLSSAVQVTAELNEIGDGFVLIDDAGGTGTLKVEDVDSDTAADLRLTGDAVTGGDGRQRIISRFAALITVEAGDTLDDVVAKINGAEGFVSASVFNDGSAFNAYRLVLNATTGGAAGRLVIDDSGLSLGFATTSQGRDALLRVGDEAASGFLIASATGSFPVAVTGIDVQALAPGSTPAEVKVERDNAPIEEALQSFIKGFNAFVNAAREQTKFDPETEKRGILQGEGVVLRAQGRLNNLVSRQFNGFGGIRSLRDLGVGTKSDGTLELDVDKLEKALAANRVDVEKFLSSDKTGFAAVAKEVLDALTAPNTGAFALDTNALQQSVDSISDRITDLEAILLVHQDRLLRQFAHMESILGGLTSQQEAIARIAPLQIGSVGKGILS